MDAALRWHAEPYRGLAAFDIAHADIFHGRDGETDDLRQRLRDQARTGCAFAVIVGASGSGKSSLTCAGVAASLLQHTSDDGVKEWRAAFFVSAVAMSREFLPQSDPGGTDRGGTSLSLCEGTCHTTPPNCG